jgi:hypothetical protein
MLQSTIEKIFKRSKNKIARFANNIENATDYIIPPYVYQAPMLGFTIIKIYLLYVMF